MVIIPDVITLPLYIRANAPCLKLQHVGLTRAQTHNPSSMIQDTSIVL